MEVMSGQDPVTQNDISCICVT